MSTNNIYFCGEIRKILCGYPLLSVAMEKFLNIKHKEVAQTRFQNLNLHKKLIKLQVLNSFLC